jgi:glycosyltransferase involved in cell wall biosynthesis
MRIGLIAPPWVPVPPIGYGGTEVVVDNLARSLSARGHDVHLFTVGESRCPVRRNWLYVHPSDPMGTSVEEAAHVLAAYDALADVDVIHDHSVLGPLVSRSYSRHRVPVVSTHHGAFTAENQRIFAEIARHAAVVAISHDQAGRAGRVPISAVIHHGIDLDAYRPGPGDGGYLLFLGRMSPDKGVHLAVRAARAAGLPLRLASKIREAAEWDYFEQDVRPLLGPDDDLTTEPGFAQRLQLLRHAVALVNPIRWPEPFGLVMAESLACGTPVIGYANGAAPEIVDHGRTGFLCADEQALVTSIGRASELDRSACRAAVEKRFSMQRMAYEHEALYRQVVNRPILDTEVSACPSRHSHGPSLTSLQRRSPHPMP